MSRTAKLIIALREVVTSQVEQAMGKSVIGMLLDPACSLVEIELDQSDGALRAALEELVEGGKIPKPITVKLPNP